MEHFLKDLPVYHSENFTRLHEEPPAETSDGNGTHRSRPPLLSSALSRHRGYLYVPTTDKPSEQIITTEKTSVLLRYLQQEWDKKAKSSSLGTKREPQGSPGGDEVPRKRTRMGDPGTSS